MRAVVQRVQKASVVVDKELIGSINSGILLFLGVEVEDKDSDFDYIFKKVTNLRIFDDEDGIMNKSIQDVGGSILVVSQFTLYGDARKGNRPSYIRAAKFDNGKDYYERFIKECENLGLNTSHGSYGADMKVELVNDGPVTILLDSSKII